MFAVSRAEPGVSWALDQSELAALLSGPLDSPVGTERCVTTGR